MRYKLVADNILYFRYQPAGGPVMRRNPPAVDATGARVLGIDPRIINYLAACRFFLGPVDEQEIPRRGETIDAVKTNFALLERIHAHRGPSAATLKTRAGLRGLRGMPTYRTARLPDGLAREPPQSAVAAGPSAGLTTHQWQYTIRRCCAGD
jgi:hypothetical protein